MISGANEEQLEIANDRADLLLEIDRLNNIINEFEKWLIDKQELTCGSGITRDYLYAYENCLEELKELKEKE